MGLPSKCVKTLQSHAGSVSVAKLDSMINSIYSIIIIEGGDYCLSGGSDKSVKLWNPFAEYDRPIQEYTGHSWEVTDLAMYM